MPLSCPFFNSKQIKKGLKPLTSTIIQTHGGTCLVLLPSGSDTIH
nr:MAG TPA: hypothetical protein [Caudoviricetes sp.]